MRFLWSDPENRRKRVVRDCPRIAGIFVLFSRKAEKKIPRAYGDAQLQRGLQTQDQLMAETKKARDELAKSDLQAQKKICSKVRRVKQKMSSAMATPARCRKS